MLRFCLRMIRRLYGKIGESGFLGPFAAGFDPRSTYPVHAESTDMTICYTAEEQKKNKEENPPAPLKEENKKKKLTQTRARKQTDTRDRCAKSLYRQFFHRDVPSIRKKERQRAP